MISRAAALPRVCLRCRLNASRQRAPLWPRPYFVAGHHRTARSYTTNGTGESGEETEKSQYVSTDDTKQQIADFIAQLSRRDVEAKNEAPAEIDTDLDVQGLRSKDRESHRLGAEVDDISAVNEVGQAPDSRLVEQQDESFLEDSIEPELDGALEQDFEESDPGWERKAHSRVSNTFHHHLLDQQSIGDALGRPVEALIIKNPDQMRAARVPIPELEDDVAHILSSIDREDLVPKEQDPESDTPEAVRRNIEELRPTDATVLRSSDFNKLMAVLVEGFTRKQLTDYYDHIKSENRKSSEDLEAYSWIKRRTPWITSTSGELAKLRPKQSLVVMIMQEKWNLEKREDIDGIGKMRVWVAPNTFNLLAGESGSSLKGIKTDLIDVQSGESIESDPAQKSLLIRTRRSTVSAILKQLDDLVNRRVSREVAIPMVKPADLSPVVLKALERVTGTSLTVIKGNEKQQPKLKVTWLATTQTSQPGNTEQKSTGTEDDLTHSLEDPADMVVRFLTSKTSTIRTRTAELQMAEKNEGVEKARFLPYHDGQRAMSWRDKLRSWFRLTQKSHLPMAPTLRPRHVLSRLVLPKQPSLLPGNSSADRLSATFGHILHDKRMLNEGKGRRLLVPIKPHPAALASVTPQNQVVHRRTTIILHFNRSPSEAAKLPNTYMPPVRLVLPVDTGTDLSSFTIPPHSTLHCVYPWYENDILMPDEQVDVRVSLSRFAKLDTTDAETQQPSLHKFLAASEFNLLEGRLKTPPSTSFNIPQSWLRTSHKSRKKDENDELVTLVYQFAGLEVHQSVEMEFKGQTLRYNSIEAGHHGGKRQELSLLAGPPDKQEEALDAERRTSFLKLASEIAMGKQFSWAEGFKNMSATGATQLAAHNDAMDEIENGAQSDLMAADEDPDSTVSMQAAVEASVNQDELSPDKMTADQLEKDQTPSSASETEDPSAQRESLDSSSDVIQDMSNGERLFPADEDSGAPHDGEVMKETETMESMEETSGSSTNDNSTIESGSSNSKI